MFGNKPKCELNFSNAVQCLVAIILSAQCTDKRVNIVTETLFKKYKTAEDFARADLKELENEIYSTGFYHNKAKNIVFACRDIVEKHNGEIPCDLDELVALDGVGRKTASVFLVEWCKIPAMPVDTHVARISKRLGFSDGKNPEQIEKDLRALLPKDLWCDGHLYMVLFGRYHCTAKNPKCADCEIKNFCNYNSFTVYK